MTAVCREPLGGKRVGGEINPEAGSGKCVLQKALNFAVVFDQQQLHVAMVEHSAGL
jgi:hypothetical protein